VAYARVPPVLISLPNVYFNPSWIDQKYQIEIEVSPSRLKEGETKRKLDKRATVSCGLEAFSD
jgi:hypothetical protein